MSSIIRDYTAIGDRLDCFCGSVSAEVFRLAQLDYLTINSQDGHEVRLTRTDKPSLDLPRESQVLLHALFGYFEQPGTKIDLSYAKQLPISQSLAVIANNQLRHEGYTKKVDVSKFSNHMMSGYVAVALAAFATLVWPLGFASFWFLWFTLAVLGGLIFTMFYIDPVANRGYKFTKAGQKYLHDVKAIKHHCMQKDVKTSQNNLPYELLWHGTNGAYFACSIREGLFNKKPNWYTGQNWPEGHLLVSDYVNNIFRAMCNAFRQRYKNPDALLHKIDFNTFVEIKATFDFIPEKPAPRPHFSSSGYETDPDCDSRYDDTSDSGDCGDGGDGGCGD